MDENECIHQNFITLTFGLSFLLKFCGDDILITEIIFIKFHKTIHSFNSKNKKVIEKIGEKG